MLTFFRLVARLPLSWLHALGALLGWLTWLFSPTYRRHMRENMTLALGEHEARRLQSMAIREAGKGGLELARIWLRPLEETAALVVQVSGWEVVEEHHLRKVFPFADFAGALRFTNRAGDVAEEQNHHPEICVTWGKATVTIWTHKIDGLSENDFILAAKIDDAADAV